ncbi:MAG: PDZ domain-containing protein [Vicinamibacterales bacterium]|jgi:S1-C subfamily serine protease|nr:PDZ domain-containing protein [Vicinamibacterales bacterium]MDP7480147.1 PDZ domain-containing protein [Vicinamibacterales bacterium]MDP7692360.1 PDZ domain-containing protein [Vicinamibacterales bacterium]HJN46780.1 PDZ domain-containing protein [Vicinamibacterales bacterium]
MQMRYGFVRVSVVAGIMCAVLLGLPLGATAQWRSGERARIFAPQDLAGRSHVGLSIEDVADNDAADEGAVIVDVRPESPAASAGFLVGDVLVEFDGERVRSASQLTRLVRETPVGRTVSSTVVRDGTQVELEVTPEQGGGVMATVQSLDHREGLGDVEILRDYVGGFEPDAARPFVYGFRSGREPARLGVNVQELSPQLADYFGVDDGVLVSSVEEESVGEQAGLQAGDVITSVDGRVVEDIATLRRRLSAVDPGEEVSIGLTRAGREMELAATTREEPARRRRSLELFGNNGPAI